MGKLRKYYVSIKEKGLGNRSYIIGRISGIVLALGEDIHNAHDDERQYHLIKNKDHIRIPVYTTELKWLQIQGLIEYCYPELEEYGIFFVEEDPSVYQRERAV